LIVAFDYGQIEARVIAMFTRDRVFCKALWENYDIHMEWAERLARAYPARIGGKQNLTDKKVMKDFRTDIKNQWTFPLFFGARLESAAEYLKIPEETLRPHYNEFWRTFSGVKGWQERLLESYRKIGYVECLTGRRRRGPLTLNQVINSPVQGSAAEIVLDGMSRLSEAGDSELQPEINIHDDLTYCRVPIKRVDDIAEKVISAMLSPPFDFINVPITVEMSVGQNWMPYDAKLNPEGLNDVGVFSSDKWFK
jgi:DNA polymerase I-like protein with 3'-5' exonuclease and polymerase domains